MGDNNENDVWNNSTGTGSDQWSGSNAGNPSDSGSDQWSGSNAENPSGSGSDQWSGSNAGNPSDSGSDQWSGSNAGNPSGFGSDQWNGSNVGNLSDSGSNQWNNAQGNNQWGYNQDSGQPQYQGMRAGDEFRQDSGQFTQAPEDGYYVPEEPNPGLAVAGMVCGILSLVCCCAGFLRLTLAIVGIVFSAIALSQDKPGKGMAVAGLVCSIITLVLTVLLVVMAFVVGANYSSFQEAFPGLTEITYNDAGA